MNILELLSDKCLDLPKDRDGEISKGLTYFQFVFELIKEYNTLIGNLDNFIVAGNDNYNGIKHDFLIKHLVNKLVYGIIKSISSYHNGDPAEAYIGFDKMLSKSEIPIENIKGYLSKIVVKSETRFYRIRKLKHEGSFAKGDLFHVPYEKREKISTTRFSIAGVPCLYLSDSIYTAAIELGENDLRNLSAARFEIDNLFDPPFCYLDLTDQISKYRIKYINEKHPIDGLLMRFLVTWPLLMTSSIKVYQPNKPFIPEYIIPQLLLQWIRKNDHEIHGIKYSSSKIPKSENFAGDFFNIVLPCKDIRSTGYCSYLRRALKMTDPMTIGKNSEYLTSKNFSIQYIEQNHKRVEYCNTDYALFENQLILTEADHFKG